MDQNQIKVDNTGVDPNIGKGTNKGTVSSILESRQDTKGIFQQQGNSILGSQKEIEGQIKGIESILKEINDLGGEYEKTISKQKEFKELIKTLQDLRSVQADITNIVKNQNVSAEKLNDVYSNSQVALLKSREYSQEVLDIHDSTGKELKKQTDEYKFQAQLRKKTNEEEIDAIKRNKKEVEQLIKESRKNMGEALAGSIKELRTSLKDALDTFNIQDIQNALKVERSSRTLIQEDIQRAFQINKGEFNDLKKDVLASYNTSLYSQDEVMSAYDSLQKLGIDSQEETTKYFNTVLEGQSLVGMSVETQAELIGLGNTYNRDMLTFMTNRTAQYMQTATNISKQQLNELISLNINMAKDLADKGYTDPAILENMTNAGIALANLNGGDERYSNYYTSAMGEISGMDTNTLGAMFGMDQNQIRDALTNTDLFSLFDNTQGQIGATLDAARGGDENAITELVKGFGLSNNFESLLRKQVEMEQQGINIQQEIANQEGTDNEDALLSLDEIRNDTLTGVQEAANATNAWLDANVDWATVDGLQNSLAIIIGILSAIEATLLLSNVGKLFNNKSLLGKGLGKMSSAFANAGTVGKVALGGSLLAGAGWTIADGVSGFNTTANEMYGRDATTSQRFAGAGASAVSGSTVHKNSAGQVDVGANGAWGMASGAAKGALIGTFFGPGIGTVIGGAIGAIAGGIGGLFKGNKAEEEQKKLLEDQLEAEKETAENTAAMADQSAAPTWANRLVASYRPAYESGSQQSGVVVPVGGEGKKSITKSYAGGESTNGMIKGFTGSHYQQFGPWSVTSDWGPRGWYRYDPNHKDAIKDPKHKYYNHYWYDDVHYGIDLSKGGSQAIYATAGGTAKVINSGSGFGNHVRVTDGDREYIYAHMSSASQSINGQEIAPGTFLGYMGNTGNSDGQHLHFEVRENGKAVHPVPYLSTMLYSGDSEAGLAYDPVAWAEYVEKNGLTPVSNTEYSTEGAVPSNSSGPEGGFLKESIIKLTNFGGEKDNPVVKGLSTINQTLIDLSNKQSEQEAILQMLSSKGKQNPRLS